MQRPPIRPLLPTEAREGPACGAVSFEPVAEGQIMKLVGFLGWISAVALAAACSSSSADGDGSAGSGDPTGGANPQQIADCKSSCDQLKFFDCNDAQDQATCYDNCSEASGAQIELFVACVTNDTCDPECSTHIQPEPEPSSGPTGSPTGDPTSNSSNSTCASDGCNDDTACGEACESLQFFSCIDAATFALPSLPTSCDMMRF